MPRHYLACSANQEILHFSVLTIPQAAKPPLQPAAARHVMVPCRTAELLTLHIDHLRHSQARSAISLQQAWPSNGNPETQCVQSHQSIWTLQQPHVATT